LITIRPIVAGDVTVFREVRLRALKDTPLAFGSTFERESALTEEQWVERTLRWQTDPATRAFLAFDGDCCVGLVGSFTVEEKPDRLWVIMMWVAPEVRRQGVGQRLLAAVEEFARGRKMAEIGLEVNNCNQAAYELYRREGYVPNGNTKPYPNNARFHEIEMIKPL
jgi:ribosomal protein S18 acetylase RimI-like enzyme